MAELGFHLVFRTHEARVIAVDAAAQRIVAGTAHRLGEAFGVYAFRAAGDHLHVGAFCDRKAAGRFAKALGSSLTQTLGLRSAFAPTYLEPMLDQDHVERVFGYIHRNAEKHEVGNDPTHEASSIQALLGLRMAPNAFLLRIRTKLPGVNRRLLLSILGIDELEPCVRVELLADAAAGAVGLARLDESDLASMARAAAVRLALPTVTLPGIAEALGLSERSVRRLRSAPPNPQLERMIALRMGHRTALGDRARLDLPLTKRAAGGR